MNRYIAVGLLADMRSGNRVLYVGDNLAMARHAFDAAAQGAFEGERVVRANGRESIFQSDGAGSIMFLSKRSSLRGLGADVVFVDTDNLFDEQFDLFRDLRLVIAASPHGEIIRP